MAEKIKISDLFDFSDVQDLQELYRRLEQINQIYKELAKNINQESESNDIMFTLESMFPDNTPLLPPATDEQDRRVRPLLQLERKCFSIWFSWLTSPRDMSGQMHAVLEEIDTELARFISLVSVQIIFSSFSHLIVSHPYFPPGFHATVPLRQGPTFLESDSLWLISCTPLSWKEWRPLYRTGKAWRVAQRNTLIC